MTSRPDSPADLTRQREAMIRDQLEGRGIRDERVLSAMRRVPRERFVPETLRPDAYADQALPVECGQTISQPYMVAGMSELCEIEPRQRVLEIGTGTGYQTAVLAALAGRVFTIEWRLPLMRAAADRLGDLGIHNVTFRCGDGSLGWPEEAPFDAILVTAGGPHVPPALPQQLAVGGRLVIPVGPHNDQTLVRVRRTESGMQEEELFKCRFVKLLGEQGWEA